MGYLQAKRLFSAAQKIKHLFITVNHALKCVCKGYVLWEVEILVTEPIYTKNVFIVIFFYSTWLYFFKTF